jgi:serine/threonine protein kinase
VSRGNAQPLGPAAEPARLGRYRLLRKIAVGGMAEIYLARVSGAGGFEKDVVVKRILPQLAESDEVFAMFLDEARIAATLQHPNLVQIYDAGQSGSEFFIAMEYLDGADLHTIRRVLAGRQRGMPLQHAVFVTSSIASGLHYAHEKRGFDGKPLSIVHRDVNPQNVFLTREGGIKLVDFGIAKATNRMSTTLHGTLKGKLAYMSPEQCRAEVVDRRSDIYSLGILLYELTTGRRPYHGRSEYELLRDIVEAEVPLPGEIAPGYPPDLEAITMRALARDRASRYPDALSMLQDLERFARRHALVGSTLAMAEFLAPLLEEAQRQSEERQRRRMSSGPPSIGEIDLDREPWEETDADRRQTLAGLAARKPSPRPGTADPAPAPAAGVVVARLRTGDPAPRARTGNPTTRARTGAPTTRARTGDPVPRARTGDPAPGAGNSGDPAHAPRAGTAKPVAKVIVSELADSGVDVFTESTARAAPVDLSRAPEPDTRPGDVAGRQPIAHGSGTHPTAHLLRTGRLRPEGGGPHRLDDGTLAPLFLSPSTGSQVPLEREEEPWRLTAMSAMPTLKRIRVPRTTPLPERAGVKTAPPRAHRLGSQMQDGGPARRTERAVAVLTVLAVGGAAAAIHYHSESPARRAERSEAGTLAPRVRPPAVGALIVTSDPPGAAVWLDLGLTPTVGAVDVARPHVIRLEHDGYGSRDISVRPQAFRADGAGQPRAFVSAELAPLGPLAAAPLAEPIELPAADEPAHLDGRIHVASRPDAATVWLLVGVTPARIALPTARRHQLRVARDGDLPSFVIASPGDFDASGEARLSVRLAPRTPP